MTLRVQLRNPGTRGYTLIELLIVVAIIAIMSAASMTIFVAPMQENAIASIDNARQNGESTFFARLVEDAHSANRILAAQPGKLSLETTGTVPQTITYYTDEQHSLRRHVAKSPGDLKSPNAGAALLENVQTFTPEQISDGKECRITLASATTRYARTFGESHTIVLGIGSQGWTGREAQP